MAQYTIEDIEIIRQKSGISYEEAVNLLEYHNGSLARALVDLEKNGRIKDTRHSKNSSSSTGKNIFSFLYRTRMKVSKEQVPLLNISILFVIFAVLTAPWVVITGIAISFVLGYRVFFERNSKDFSADNIEDVVKNASANVKKTYCSVVMEIENEIKQQDNQEPVAPPPPKEEIRTESPASGTTPVNVQFPDGGSVEVRHDDDGFHEADIQ